MPTGKDRIVAVRVSMFILLTLVLQTAFVKTGLPACSISTQSTDNTLAVYVGAHPDDIDIGISGSLYKHDLGRHPILWVVVTDGGADSLEYEREANCGRIAPDAQYDVPWVTPDNATIFRGFYSFELTKIRCGGYVNGTEWVEEPTSCDTIFGVEMDWRSRVNTILGPDGERVQLTYPDPQNHSRRLMYPDFGLSESGYRESIAEELENVIDQAVVAGGYRKDMFYINSHAPDAVSDGWEHPDHRITGEAVLLAIKHLHEDRGYGQISARFYRISSIDPKAGYCVTNEDISQQKTEKSNLCKACRETWHLAGNNSAGENGIYLDWPNYPNDPGNLEQIIQVDYYDAEAPVISDIVQDPASCSVTWQDEVEINATITDDSLWGIKNTTLDYAFANQTGVWIGHVTMLNTEGTTWSATIPALPLGTNVTYAITSQDNRGNIASSAELGYQCKYSVVPEFPTFIALLLLITIAMSAVIAYRKRSEHDLRAPKIS